MICDTCIHKEVCYENEEDRKALKLCADYFNLVEELEKIKEDTKHCMILSHFKEEDIKDIIGCFEYHISELKGENNDRRRYH